MSKTTLCFAAFTSCPNDRNYEITTRDIQHYQRLNISAGCTPVTWYRLKLTENSQFASCNYEFYEGVNAFYKLESRNYDMV